MLTLGAVAVAVALMIWTLALYEGWIQQMIRGATVVETSQVQIHTAAYVEQPRPYRSFPADRALFDRILADPEVVAVAPRVHMYGLAGDEERSQVVRFVGVDPERESRTTPVAEAVVEGRWLSPLDPDAEDDFFDVTPREAVLGAGVARQLRAGPGSELVIFLEAADGSLGSELLEVVGVVRTANTRIDQSTIYLKLDDAQLVGALEGQLHEISVRTRDLTRARETAASLAAALGAAPPPDPDGAAPPDAARTGEGTPADEALVVRPWQEILPAVDQMIGVFRSSYWILYLLVYLLAAVGVLNTQRMSALERHREFGVMMAIGMRPRRMTRTLLVETGVLGLAGALVGAALGTALSWYHTVRGLDLRLLAEQADFTFMGVAFSERLFFALQPGHVIQPVLIMLLVAVASGLWPAIQSARIDPAPTIAGRAA